MSQWKRLYNRERGLDEGRKFVFTKDELDKMARMWLDGKSNNQIAKELKVSKNTISTYICGCLSNAGKGGSKAAKIERTPELLERVRRQRAFGMSVADVGARNGWTEEMASVLILTAERAPKFEEALARVKGEDTMKKIEPEVDVFADARRLMAEEDVIRRQPDTTPATVLAPVRSTPKMEKRISYKGEIFDYEIRPAEHSLFIHLLNDHEKFRGLCDIDEVEALIEELAYIRDEMKKELV